MNHFAKVLLDSEAVKLTLNAPAAWNNGWKTPMVCDVRKLVSNPQQRNLIAARLSGLIGQFGEIDMVLGGESKDATTFGVLISDKLYLPYGFITEGSIEGFDPTLFKGKKVVIIDDCVATGDTTLDSVMAVRKAGAFVAGVATVFNFNLAKTMDDFAMSGVRLVSTTNFEGILEYAEEEKLITDIDKARFEEWHSAPEKWRR